MKVEVAVLGSPSLIVLVVSVDVKTMLNWFPLWVTAEAETKHPPPTLPFICLILPSRCIFTPMMVM